MVWQLADKRAPLMKDFLLNDKKAIESITVNAGQNMIALANAESLTNEKLR